MTEHGTYTMIVLEGQKYIFRNIIFFEYIFYSNFNKKNPWYTIVWQKENKKAHFPGTFSNK